MVVVTGGSSLYVGELHQDTTEATLYDVFNQIGPVASIRVCRDAVTRRSLGYAYVNYVNGADAERALDSLNYSHIRSRQCRIMLGSGIFIGQTCSHRPQNEEALGRCPAWSIPTSIGDSTAPIGPG